jgi:hypothetical protein
MGVNNGDKDGDKDGDGVDEDGSGGNSPSRQGARIETSVPRKSSSMAVSLQNFLWIDADSFRVFAMETIYRRKGEVGGSPRGPHHSQARLEVGPHHGMVWPPPGSSLSPLWIPSSCREK